MDYDYLFGKRRDALRRSEGQRAGNRGGTAERAFRGYHGFCHEGNWNGEKWDGKWEKHWSKECE